MAEFDVVIPVYNGKKWLKDTINSASTQSVRPGKIIVVDDHSTDDSWDIASAIPGITLVSNPGKGGEAARNYGVSLADAPYVAFLDQDDLWHPEHLTNMKRAFEEFPEAGMAASYAFSFKDGSPPVFDPRYQDAALFNPWDIFPSVRIACNPSYLVMKRGPAQDIKWTEEHTGFPDYSIVLRTAARYPLIRVNSRTVAYRKHSGSEYAQLRRNPLAHLKQWEKVSKDILEYRLRFPCSQTEQERLTKRQGITPVIHDLMESLYTLDHTQMRAVSLRFESIVRDEPKEFTGLFFQEIIDYLWADCPAQNPNYIWDRYEMLLEHWDMRSAPLSGSLLSKTIYKSMPGMKFHSRLLLKKPWSTKRISFVISALSHKITRTTKPFAKTE